MSIDDFSVGKKKVCWVCDGCGAKATRDVLEGQTFNEVWRELKAEGWRAVLKRVDGVTKKVWVHFCPRCV